MRGPSRPRVPCASAESHRVCVPRPARGVVRSLPRCALGSRREHLAGDTDGPGADSSAGSRGEPAGSGPQSDDGTWWPSSSLPAGLELNPFVPFLWRSCERPVSSPLRTPVTPCVSGRCPRGARVQGLVAASPLGRAARRRGLAPWPCSRGPGRLGGRRAPGWGQSGLWPRQPRALRAVRTRGADRPAALRLAPLPGGWARSETQDGFWFAGNLP